METGRDTIEIVRDSWRFIETGGDTIEIRRDWLRLAEIHWRRDGSLIEFIFLRKKKREPQ
jgi:hypothetical protein